MDDLRVSEFAPDAAAARRCKAQADEQRLIAGMRRSAELERETRERMQRQAAELHAAARLARYPTERGVPILDPEILRREAERKAELLERARRLAYRSASGFYGGTAGTVSAYPYTPYGR